MTSLARDAAGWMRHAAERVERGQLPLVELPEALREIADRVEEAAGPIDRGPGIGGVAREDWGR